MPFQDIEDVSTTEYPQSPSVVEAWLRKIFIEDWGLKLLALIITLLLWLAVTGVNKPVTIRTGVQLNFIRPENLDISNDPPKTVDVLLTGRRSKLANLNQLDLVATVDLSDQHAGERVVRLSPDRVQMELPEGVKIESFQPATIPIHLEPIVERQVAVDVKLEGKPVPGFEVYAVNASPATVTVRGPAGLINELKKVPTETISVEGKKESFSVAHVAVDISDHKIDAVDSAVDATVEIGERRTEKTLSGVSVTSSQGGTPHPQNVTVTVFGPESILSQLNPASLKVVLAITSAGTIAPTLETPPTLQNRIVLKSTKPSSFSITR